MLYAREYERDNYEWLYCQDGGELLYVMKRMDKNKAYVCAINFGREDIKEFPLALDKEEAEEKTSEEKTAKKKKNRKKDESWNCVLCTGWEKYGGSIPVKKEKISSKERVMKLSIPGYCAVIYEVEK